MSDWRLGYHWHRPKFVVYRAGEPRHFQIMLNRYPRESRAGAYVVIGCAMQVYGRVFSLVWGKLGGVISSDVGP